jgi:hypothetical protein
MLQHWPQELQIGFPNLMVSFSSALGPIPFIELFFSRIHTFKTNFPNFFKNNNIHNAKKIHQEKSLF